MKVKEKKRIRLIDRTLENDIRYRGPLSYRHLRIVGWACIVVSLVSSLLALAAKALMQSNTGLASLCSSWSTILSLIGSLSVSLFLVANVALILQSEENIKKLVLTHLAFAIGVYVGFLVVYYRYLYGYAEILFKEQGDEVIDALITSYFSKHLSFNVFIDLLMFSSTYFFSVYEPKKVFVGKKIIIFRLFTLFPAVYGIAACLLNGFGNGLGWFSIPVFLMPLFPSKSLFTYLVFCIIIVFVRSRKKWYMKTAKACKITKII